MKKSFCWRGLNPCFTMPLILLACAPQSPFNRSYVSETIRDRSGSGLRGVEFADSLKIPPNIDLSDGLSEDDAVLLALWNNAQFQVDLLDLGFARADLLEAGLLRNPAFSLLFPIGPKQLEAAVNLPIDFLWQRPFRLAAAKKNAERIAENLVHNGLGLVRNVRIAHANLDLAQEKARIAIEEAELQNEIAEIATTRLQAGDISELEESAFRLMAASTREKSLLFSREVKRAEIELSNLIGYSADVSAFEIQPSALPHGEKLDPEALIQKALAARPDLRAAEISIEVTGKKMGWEASKILTLTAVLDANAEGKEGFEMGPGLQTEIPLFNWNNAGRKRARIELERAARNYIVVRQAIITQVRQAHNDLLTALESLNILRNNILPSANKAVKKAEKAYTSGESSYVEFLDFKRQWLDARLREAESMAEVRRSYADLQFGVGCNLVSSD